jgi:hypothetical protein
MGRKLSIAIARAKEAERVTGQPHYVIRDSHGEFTYMRKLSSEDRFFWTNLGEMVVVK